MPENQTRQLAQNDKAGTVWEYRVRATVRVGDALNVLETDWDRRRDYVIRTAERLEDDGHMVEIECRERYETVDFNEVP